MSVWAGLFGFTEVRTGAGIAAGVIEVAAFAVLAVAAAVPAARPQTAMHAGPRLPLARLQPSVPAAAAAAAGVSALALTLLGAAAAQVGGPAPATPSKAAVVLKTATIGGATVLANAKGLTLYWFALTPRADRPATGPALPTGHQSPASQPLAHASPATSAASNAQVANFRTPTTGIPSTPMSATAPPARPVATTST